MFWTSHCLIQESNATPLGPEVCRSRTQRLSTVRPQTSSDLASLPWGSLPLISPTTSMENVKLNMVPEAQFALSFRWSWLCFLAWDVLKRASCSHKIINDRSWLKLRFEKPQTGLHHPFGSREVLGPILPAVGWPVHTWQKSSPAKRILF